MDGYMDGWMKPELEGDLGMQLSGGLSRHHSPSPSKHTHTHTYNKRTPMHYAAATSPCITLLKAISRANGKGFGLHRTDSLASL